LVLLTGGQTAHADDECETGATVVCSPAGNPYVDGIFYSTTGGLALSFEPGVAVNAALPSGRAALQIADDSTDLEGEDMVRVDKTAGSLMSDRSGIRVTRTTNGTGSHGFSIITGDVTATGGTP
jgi:hypothetical protein